MAGKRRAAMLAVIGGGLLATSGSSQERASDGPMLTIAALGDPEGVRFEALYGERTLFFRLPAGAAVRGARLVLPYRTFGAYPLRRVITVSAAERVIGQATLTDAGTINLPLPPGAVSAGTVTVTLHYGGGVSANRCFDARLSGDSVVLDPAGGLALDLAPEAPLSVAATIAFLPTAPLVVVPTRPTSAQAAAALSVATARGGATIVTAPPADGRGYVRIDAADAPALRAERAGAAAVLAIGGSDPAGAARAAFGSDAALLSAAVVDRVTLRRAPRQQLTLDALGADTSIKRIRASGSWALAVPAARLPVGKELAGIDLDLAAVPSVPGRDAVAVSINGALLGSAPLHTGGRTKLRVRVPQGAGHSLNGIAIVLTRDRADDCGGDPLSWPAQLLGSSKVLLRDAAPLRDFHDLAARTGKGVSVVLASPAQLPLAARAVASLVAADAPIRVSYGAIPASGPVVVVADQAPAGVTPPLVTRGGRLVLAAPRADFSLDLPRDPAVTVAQMVEQGGRPLLWIRPGRFIPASMWLDQGDVALVAASGAVSALSSTRPALAANELPADPAAGWLARWWWLVLAGVLLAAAVIAWSFLPSIKRPRPGQG